MTATMRKLSVHPLTAADLTLDLPRAPRPATAPPEAAGRSRDDVRMLVIDRSKGTYRHLSFRDLPCFVRPGDLVVVNDSATLPAVVPATCKGQSILLHIAVRLTDGRFVVERRTLDGGPDEEPFVLGDIIDVEGAAIVVQEPFHPRSRLWVVAASADLWQIAQRWNRPIQYGYARRDLSLTDYQTIFARRPGSAEMPSAGRPFSHRVLRGLAASGARIASLTLHTTVSSHEVRSSLADHPVLPEWYHIPEWTACAVETARSRGNRIIAVGTTVVRALESSAAAHAGKVVAESAWTTHLVTPDTPPRVVDSLFTGMHDQQSSHLALLLAFVERNLLTKAYQSAVAENYKWHEFGDTSLIL
jgi:S-adenosylmethionine:tRNA ribosyltransferase-isomerase